VPEQYVHRIGRTARAGADGLAIDFCSPDERGILRDIERTTRQKIAVAPLPADFMAAAEAFRRLKPEAKPQPAHRASTKGHRRADGQRRDNRNDRQQRHPQRADGHPAHRPDGGQPKRPFRGRRRFGGSRVA
jgi:ATP-dependent RNA helicase RhlE